MRFLEIYCPNDNSNLYKLSYQTPKRVSKYGKTDLFYCSECESVFRMVMTPETVDNITVTESLLIVKEKSN